MPVEGKGRATMPLKSSSSMVALGFVHNCPLPGLPNYARALLPSIARLQCSISSWGIGNQRVNSFHSYTSGHLPVMHFQFNIYILCIQILFIDTYTYIYMDHREFWYQTRFVRASPLHIWAFKNPWTLPSSPSPDLTHYPSIRLITFQKWSTFPSGKIKWLLYVVMVCLR